MLAKKIFDSHISIAFFSTAIIGCILIGCQKPAPIAQQMPNGLTKISLALNWIPDSQHGGFYAAKTHGFYADEGLDVEILPGGPNAPVIQQVALKRTQFGIGNADQILMAREQEAPIVAVMAAMQNSPRCIMVHAESGIDTFDQIRNMKLSVGTAKAFAKFLEANVKLENVSFVPYTGSIAPFLQDSNLGQQAYVFSEPHVAEAKGKDVNTLMVSDLGFNPYSSCVFVHKDMLIETPDVVRRFVAATVKGWQRYLESPETSNLAIQQDNPAMELSHLQFGATAIKTLCLPDGMNENELGAMRESRWHELAQQLQELDFLNDAKKYRNAFSLEYLPNAP